MKRINVSLLATMFLLSMAFSAQAQLNNGEIVKIKNVNSGKYAQPENGAVKANAQIVIYSNNEALQKWKVILVAGGYYKFQNVANGNFLGVLDASKSEYGFICQKPGGTQADFQWKLEKSGTGYKMKNRNSNLLAAVEGGGTANNAKLIQWSDQGQPDILWQFEVAGTNNSTTTGKKVLFDVVLNYVAVSEATRNQIDNGDCRRIFGQVSTELWELDENNEMKTRLRSYNNQPELIYNQTNYNNPPTAGLSYHQDNPAASNNSQMGKVTYNIPESLLKDKKVMLVVKTNIGTRHKDNDFATYDALKMKEVVESTFILDYRASRSETIETITDLTASRRDMHLQDLIIPFAIFQRTDDTHKIWTRITCKRN